MSESNGTKKNKTIAFRITEEEYALAERAARAAGVNTNKLGPKRGALSSERREGNDQSPTTDL